MEGRYSLFDVIMFTTNFVKYFLNVLRKIFYPPSAIFFLIYYMYLYYLYESYVGTNGGCRSDESVLNVVCMIDYVLHYCFVGHI